MKLTRRQLRKLILNEIASSFEQELTTGYGVNIIDANKDIRNHGIIPVVNAAIHTAWNEINGETSWNNDEEKNKVEKQINQFGEIAHDMLIDLIAKKAELAEKGDVSPLPSKNDFLSEVGDRHLKFNKEIVRLDKNSWPFKVISTILDQVSKHYSIPIDDR